jgi:hypothetical protein
MQILSLPALGNRWPDGDPQVHARGSRAQSSQCVLCPLRSRLSLNIGRWPSLERGPPIGSARLPMAATGGLFQRSHLQHGRLTRGFSIHRVERGLVLQKRAREFPHDHQFFGFSCFSFFSTFNPLYDPSDVHSNGDIIYISYVPSLFIQDTHSKQRKCQMLSMQLIDSA